MSASMANNTTFDTLSRSEFVSRKMYSRIIRPRPRHRRAARTVYTCCCAVTKLVNAYYKLLWPYTQHIQRDRKNALQYYNTVNILCCTRCVRRVIYCGGPADTARSAKCASLSNIIRVRCAYITECRMYIHILSVITIHILYSYITSRKGRKICFFHTIRVNDVREPCI